MRTNKAFFGLIAVAAAITAVFVVPFLHDTGHDLLSIPIFAFLFLLAFYGRCNPKPRRRPRRPLPTK